jgi:hypothetical protein
VNKAPWCEVVSMVSGKRKVFVLHVTSTSYVTFLKCTNNKRHVDVIHT